MNNEEMGVCLATAMRECESTIYHLCSLEQVRELEESKLDFKMLQKVAIVPHSINWSSSTCHANMGNCFGRTQIAGIELSEVFKRIRCLCTCCAGRVLIYKSGAGCSKPV